MNKQMVLNGLLIFVLILAGCSKKEKEVVVVQEKNNEVTIEEQIAQMTLDEKIGQLIMVGVEGESFSPEMEDLIQKEKVGGIILLPKNISSAEQTLKLLNDLKKANEVNDIPLFLSVDEEGGTISRLPDEFDSLPTTREIGSMDSPEFSFEVGQFLAHQVKAFGYNMNMAPVLDVDSNPENPVIGDRSFGSDPDIVASLGVATMKGMQEENVIPVVKHFPGHGDTSDDSHSSLPILDADLERLNSLELIPFKRAIEEGADAVMTAHILFPKIDSSNPATLSGKVINGILRESLGFEGVIITDDLTMGAIRNSYSAGQAAVRAFLAGHDILLICHEYDNYYMAIQAMKEAVTSGKITEEQVDQSVQRILTLKKKYKLSNEPVESIDVEAINKELDKLLEKGQAS
ncbi:beta-N-acetylhexosaminidase [Chungangia koreensis]|uniref:beta-N-acetylhexosaminidase n=1 Tax=Chungangia koreensis TaxID=752657 RepID=A0ABV8X3W1_9LACT